LFTSLVKAQKDINENSLFWKITGKDAVNTSYVYGTLHSGDSRVYQFSDEVLNKLRSCDAFAMELNVSPKNRLGLMGKLTMDSAHTLKGLLGEDYDRINKIFQDSMGINLAMFNNLPPIFVSSMISQRQMKSDSALPLDFYFKKQAEKDSLKIIGLENVDEQVKVIKSIPYDKQAEMLIESVDKMGESDSLMNIMINEYVNGNVDKLVKPKSTKEKLAKSSAKNSS
ncbi:MAG: TraB/GumN family protein, partial [Flavobacteriales bacterium]